MRIILVMIVKNEQDVIRRCLESCLPFIDGYMIHDTGSTDNTVQIACETLGDAVGGGISIVNWVNFAHNRNKAMGDAVTLFGRDAYFLAMDADDVLVSNGFDAERDLGGAEVYSIGRGNGDMLNWTELLAMGGTGYWEGMIHEHFVYTSQPKKLKTLWIKEGRDGARAKNPNKFKDDAYTIQEAAKKATGLERKILMFQYAQAYEGIPDYETALILYHDFLREYPNTLSELEWNALLRVGCLQELTSKHRGEVISSYHKCIQDRPNRVEPYVMLSTYFLHIGMAQAALEVAEIAAKITKPPEKDTLCIMESFYTTQNKECLAKAKAALEVKG
jgi:glycosyltransferase involved in cell wall biosynthesis